MRLVVDNDNELGRLRSQWVMPNGEMSLALGAEEMLRIRSKLKAISPRCNALYLYDYMYTHLDRWNAIEVNFDEASEKLNIPVHLIEKYANQLESIGAFDRVEGSVYHFDPWLVFRPEFAPVEWLRELSECQA